MIAKFATLKFAGGELPARTIRARVSDESVDRQGDIVVAAGCDYSAFNKNPVVLYQHNPERPIARAKLFPGANFIDAEIAFPAPGISELSDSAYGLIKAGVLNGISIGFSPIQKSPLAGGGLKFEKWALLEISIVSVPANPNALVTQKAATSRNALAARLKAELDKAEIHHVKALDAHDAIKAGDLKPAEGLAQMRVAVEKARGHANTATLLANKLRKLPGAQSDERPDAELSFRPRGREASLAALDAADVGSAAHQSVEPLGGAHLVAKVRQEEHERMRRFYGA